MEPIYDQYGRCVGWLDDEESVIDPLGRHLAFVDEGAVFTYEGKYLGTFDEGYFRDDNGDAVAFIESAERGPLTPLPNLPPLPPMAEIPPLRPITPVPPIPPLPRLSWSGEAWDEYMQVDRRRERR